jgi:hypothetical protein
MVTLGTVHSAKAKRSLALETMKSCENTDKCVRLSM